MGAERTRQTGAGCPGALRAAGYEQTTVTEIARRAGLSERTFFRHFADKREVLFGGAAELQEVFVTSIATAPAQATPMEAVAAALDAGAALFQERREHSGARQRIISATTELRERELIKFAALSAALADTLRTRGVPDPAAALAAEAGLAVFKVAFGRWLSSPEQLPVSHFIHESLAELKSVASAG
ncbi:TetR/AcrR family transcriptional regulator [Streptacidiphilus sp. 4-A2]|nr:TetR/AcrR family transcriptional regulator [Streptacidiphilus sp. 4-A2]